MIHQNPKTQKDQILLIKRLRAPFQDCMALPGGFVDYNEDPSESCLRELLEETNIPGKILALVGVFGKALRDPRHHCVTTAYLVRPDSLNAEGLVDFKAGDDAKEAGFYDLDWLLAEGTEIAFDHKEIIAKGYETYKGLPSK